MSEAPRDRDALIAKRASRSRLVGYAVFAGMAWLLAVVARSSLILALTETLLLAAGVSYLLARIALQQVEWRRGPVITAVEDQPVQVTIELRARTTLPVLLVEIHDTFEAAARPHKRTLVRRLTRHDGWVTAGYTAVCDAGRGAYTLRPPVLQAADALGLFRLGRQLDGEPVELLVHPRPLALPAETAPQRALALAVGGAELPRAGASTTPLGVRELQEGGPRRRIHWRASARHDELVAIEYEAAGGRALIVALDLSADALRGQGRRSSVEWSIRIAAGLGCDALRRACWLGLIADDGQPRILAPRGGLTQRQRLLDLLARARPTGSTPQVQVLERGLPYITVGARVALVLPHADVDIDGLAALASAWRRRSVRPVGWLVDADRRPEAAVATADALTQLGIPTRIVGADGRVLS